MLLTDLADACRSSGLHVVEIQGWRGRGHGQMAAVKTIVCHHTAGPKTGDTPSLGVVVNGRPDLEGPLAQLYLSRSGVVHVVAAGLAYHAGAVLIPSYGNSCAIGIEAEATGIDPWPEPQWKAYARLCAALVRWYQLAPSRVLGHKEVCSPPGRKIDPNFDMGAFRGEVAHWITTPTPAAAPTADTGEDDDMTLQIRVDERGEFGESLFAECGGGGWYADGLLVVGSTFGATRVWATALSHDGYVWSLSGEDGDLVANNTNRVYQLPDGARHAVVEGYVEHAPNPHGTERWQRHGTRPWACFVGKRA